MKLSIRLIRAIAINTFGASIIVLGATHPDRITAIAISAIGTGISALRVASVALRETEELMQARQESLKWAQEAQRHLQEKRDLILQF